jgi:hypothetical protein
VAVALESEPGLEGEHDACVARTQVAMYLVFSVSLGFEWKPEYAAVVAMVVDSDQFTRLCEPRPEHDNVVVCADDVDVICMAHATRENFGIPRCAAMQPDIMNRAVCPKRECILELCRRRNIATFE